MKIRHLFVLLLLITGYTSYGQTKVPATSATDGDVKIHNNKRIKKSLGSAHATERHGQAVPKQKAYRTPGGSKEGMKKQTRSARKEKNKKAAKRGKKAVPRNG
jgi:hypothetical protein